MDSSYFNVDSERRVASPSQLRNIYDRLELQDRQAARKRAALTGFYDRNPPFSSKELVEAGQSDRTNLNFGDMEASINATRDSYWRLWRELKTIIEIKPLDDMPQDVCDLIAERFTEAYETWRDYHYEHDQQFLNLALFGMGHLRFRNKKDWVFDAESAGNIKVPSATKSKQSDITYAFMDVEYNVGDLQDMISSPEKRKIIEKQGWNPEAIQSLIDNAQMNYHETESDAGSDAETIQDQIRDNDFMDDALLTEKVLLTMCYVQEYDGKISTYTIARLSGIDDMFIRIKEDEYKTWQECIGFFFFDTGRGSYHGIKGMGIKVYNSLVTLNQMQNQLTDMGMDASMLILEHSDPQNIGDDWNKARPIRHGRHMVLPPGANLNTDMARFNFGGIFNVVRFLQVNHSNSTKIPTMVQEHMGNQNAQPKTEDLRYMSDGTQVKLSYSTVRAFVDGGNLFFPEVFKRMLSSKLKKGDDGYEVQDVFRKLLAKDGIDYTALNTDNMIIRMARPIGLESDGELLRSLEGVAQFRGEMDQYGRRRFAQDYVSARIGTDKMREYLPQLNRDELPSGSSALVMLENSAMMSGQPVQVLEEQEHDLHLKYHIPAMQEAAQSVAQVAETGADQENFQGLQRVVAYLQHAIPHARGHLQFLQANPELEGLHDQYLEIVNAIENLYRELENRTAQFMQNQQASQEAQMSQEKQMEMAMLEKQIATKYQAELTKIQGELEILRAKAQRDGDLKEQEVINKMQLKMMEQQNAANQSR